MTEFEKKITMATVVGMTGSLFLSGLQFYAGWRGESESLVAEAVHTFYDLVGGVILLFFVRYWQKPSDGNHPFGHARIETAVSLFIGLMMLPMAFGIAWNSIFTFNEIHLVSPPIFTLAAIAAAIIGQRFLYRWTMKIAREIDSMALAAKAQHYNADSLASIPVLLSVGLSVVSLSYNFIDHIGAIFVSVIILKSAWDIIYPALSQMTDESPDSDTPQRIRDFLLEYSEKFFPGRIRTRGYGKDFAAEIELVFSPDIKLFNARSYAIEAEKKLFSVFPHLKDLSIIMRYVGDV
ncbi:MAG: cation transporter [Candidatus Riflebacteria bacterium]|nr:cation transporter [Candidatus Riflebacteria bacterium]